MFQAYFEKINKDFVKLIPESDQEDVQKDIVSPLRDFVQEHFPPNLKVASGSAVDSFGHRVNNIDLLLYFHYNDKIMEMLDQAAPVELVLGAIWVVPRLTVENLNDLLQKVVSFKRLSRKADVETEGAEQRKIPATIFAYGSTLSYHQIKDYVTNFYQTHDVMTAYEVDFVTILNHSLLVKNWHEASMSYKSIETKQDTLKWFYILYHEFSMGEDFSQMGFLLRNYISEAPEYNDY